MVKDRSQKPSMPKRRAHFSTRPVKTHKLKVHLIPSKLKLFDELKDLKEIGDSKRFVKIRDLGTGTLASAWLAYDSKFANQQVVIKVIKRRNVREFEHEIAILNHLKPLCGKIIPCYRGYFVLSDTLHIVTQYLGDHWIVLKDASIPLLTKFMRTIVQSLWRALRGIHRYGITHNDVHEGNILLNINTGQCMLIDFGSAFWEKPVKRHDNQLWTMGQVGDLLNIEVLFERIHQRETATGPLDAVAQREFKNVHKITNKFGLAKLVELYIH
jgi:serine/threonine protein kinase